MKETSLYRRLKELRSKLSDPFVTDSEAKKLMAEKSAVIQELQKEGEGQ